MLRLFTSLTAMLSICLAAAPHAQAEGERPAEVRAATPLADGKAEAGWKGFKPWIARRNRGGNLLWEHTLGEEGGRFSAVAVLTGGGFVAAGSENIQVGPAWAAGFDADGKLLWTQRLGKETYDAAAIAALPDGGAVLAGGENSGAATARWAARLNAGGRLVWYRTFDGKDNRGSAGAIALLPGGAILIAGQRWHGCMCEDYRAGEPWASLLDAKGGTVWAKDFGEAFKSGPAAGEHADFLLRSAEAADGGITLKGDAIEFVRAQVTRTVGTWVLRLDAGGTVTGTDYSKAPISE